MQERKPNGEASAFLSIVTSFTTENESHIRELMDKASMPRVAALGHIMRFSREFPKDQFFVHEIPGIETPAIPFKPDQISYRDPDRPMPTDVTEIYRNVDFYDIARTAEERGISESEVVNRAVDLHRFVYDLYMKSNDSLYTESGDPVPLAALIPKA